MRSTGAFFAIRRFSTAGTEWALKPLYTEFPAFTNIVNHPVYPPRFPVPPEKRAWDVEYPDYKPVQYTHANVFKNDETRLPGGWAHPESPSASRIWPSWNGTIKKSGDYPLNPRGRTGIVERGLLGKWGPNHAVDPIVIQQLGTDLQVAMIKRSDSGLWALPGGMRDPGESLIGTLKREFIEETGNLQGEDLALFKAAVEKAFDPSRTTFVYGGFMEDHRNTDNSWMETAAFLFRLEPHTQLKLRAGDDAVDAKWLSINSNWTDVYYGHVFLVNLALKSLNLGPVLVSK